MLCARVHVWGAWRGARAMHTCPTTLTNAIAVLVLVHVTVTDQGLVEVTFSDPEISLSGPYSYLGYEYM